VFFRFQIIGVIAVCVDIVAVLYHYCTINFTNLGAGAFTVFLRHHIIGKLVHGVFKKIILLKYDAFRQRQ
jgi:hypothetical protein